MKRTNGFLLDTNVVSELSKTRPQPEVLLFYRQLVPLQTFLSPLTLGELRKGAALRARRDIVAAQTLIRWVDQLEISFEDRVLAIDRHIARIWGELSADRTRPFVDALLAATALHHNLTLVTRNVRDVQDTPVRLFNPWLDAALSP